MSHLETAKAMIAAYNAQDVDTYVSYMTDDACEANYRGDVVREGSSSHFAQPLDVEATTRSDVLDAAANATVWPKMPGMRYSR